MGNIDKTPQKFLFTVVTSATLQGAIYNESKWLDKTRFSLDSKYNKITDNKGGFELEELSQGRHNISVLTV